MTTPAFRFRGLSPTAWGFVEDRRGEGLLPEGERGSSLASWCTLRATDGSCGPGLSGWDRDIKSCTPPRGAPSWPTASREPGQATPRRAIGGRNRCLTPAGRTNGTLPSRRGYNPGRILGGNPPDDRSAPGGDSDSPAPGHLLPPSPFPDPGVFPPPSLSDPAPPGHAGGASPCRGVGDGPGPFTGGVRSGDGPGVENRPWRRGRPAPGDRPR
jgi:hypothetical protein